MRQVNDFESFWVAVNFARAAERRFFLPFYQANMLWMAHKKRKHRMTRYVWQPIETAPRDGGFVLLSGGAPQDDTTAKSFGPVVVGAFSERGDGYELWLVGGYDSFCNVFWINPTHWADLPVPPELSE